MAIGTTLESTASGIYKMTIGKWFYYGSAKNLKARTRNHAKSLISGNHHNKIAQNAFNKHQSVEFCIVEICPNADVMPESMIESEQTWIDSGYGDRHCMNIAPTAGNCMGVKHSEEARRNMSKAHIGTQSGMFHPRYGKTWSDEQREKHTASTKGKKFSELHKRNHLKAVRKKSNRMKISMAHKGRKHTPDHIEKRASKMRGSQNPRSRTIWLDHPSFGRTQFDTVNDAASFLKTNMVNLCNWISGSKPWPGDGKLQRKATAHLIGLKGGYI